MNADLQLFVRESLARGIARPAISDRLNEAGWRPEEIEAALGAYAAIDFPVPVPRRRPYLSAREAFLYLVLFATLYTTAFNVGAVLFQLIERWLPDPAGREASLRFAADAMRGATAGLIIAFPIFLGVSIHIGRSVAREPDKRGSKIRKWLTYVTLFVAAMVIIGDLTFLVSRLLAGELPGRVAAKVLVVFLIAGTVFSHYLGELRRDEREGSAPAAPLWRLPPPVVAAAVIVATVAGLLGSGSPGRARARELDAQRLEDLHSIERSVSQWAWDHRRLPATLEEVMASPTVTGVRFRDPVAGTPYEYRLLDSLRYELCATFDAPDSLSPRGDPGGTSAFWKHYRGRTCYTLDVPVYTLTHDAPRGPVPIRQ